MAKYRKKPVVIEAIQYTGNNIVEIIKFMQEGANGNKSRYLRYLRYNAKKGEYFILTPEGKYKLTEGDYIVKGVKGEFYPCKPDIFEMTYEEVQNVEGKRMSNIDYLRSEIKKLWKLHKELTDKIESLECQLAIELDKEEQEKRDWHNSNRDRGWW